MLLERYGRFVVRRRKFILTLTVVGLLAGVVALAVLPDRLKYETFVAPGTESHEGRRLLAREFGVDVPNLLLLVSARSGFVDDPLMDRAARQVTARLETDAEVTDVVSYWTSGRPASLRSRGGDRGLVIARIRGTERDADRWVRRVGPELAATGGPIEVKVSGSAEYAREYAQTLERELKRAELITAPLTLSVLILVFGSLVAAVIPLAISVIAIAGTAIVLLALTTVVGVSSFALFFTSVLGLGLALDYSLFVVNRFREELAGGLDTSEAVVRTVATAGKTVLFSAAAVGIALAALMFSPLSFLKSFGYSGAGTAVAAGLGSLIVLPALLAVLGPNVNRGTVWHRSIRPPDGDGAWHRLAVVVMRRPIVVAGAVVAVMLVAASPLLDFRPGLVDDRDLSTSAGVRQVGDVLREEFAGREGTPMPVVLRGIDATERPTEVDGFARTLAGLPGVARVDTATGSYAGAGRSVPPGSAARFSRPDATYLEVVSVTEPLSRDGERLIETIRGLPAPGGSTVLVTGEGAIAYDVTRAVIDTLPFTLIFIGVATFLALFLQFGSLLVPVKAIALNLLTLSSLFGVMVWVFQDGHLGGLGTTATGSLYINLPMMIFCLAFGLSMDYEVFLLSRIKEEYDRTGDNERSVAMGLERSGRIVSAAAVLIAVVFLASAIGGSTSFGKAFGYGLGFVVLGDAFIIRGTLIPALMKLAGPANWWAPAPLRRLHERIGISEAERPA